MLARTTSPPRSGPKSAVACGSLVLLVLAVFLPTVNFEFVNWDDPWYVTNNPMITGWTPGNLADIATKTAVRNYAPLTILSYLVDHTLYGYWPGGYHLTSVLFHALNAVLVFVLVRQLCGNGFTAWIAAALFAVHPLQVETVAWVASRKGLVSGAFILASLICWLRPNRTPREEMWAVLFHVGGLLSKALGLTVPAIVFCYDVFIGKKKVADALGRQFIPCVAGVAVLMITMAAQTSELGGIRGHLGWNKAQIAAIDAVIVWQYLGMLAWPHDLCVLYDVPTSGLGGAIALSLVGWAAVGRLVWQGRDRRPLALLACVAFGALLFPVLNFFPITTLMNDRYLYLPSIPVFALIGVALQRTFQLGGAIFGDPDRPIRATATSISLRALAGATAAILVLGYAAATRDRMEVFRNDRNLWQDAMAKSPGLTVVRIQWAGALQRDGRWAEAVAALQSALRETNPDDADRERILGKIADWSGELQRAAR